MMALDTVPASTEPDPPVAVDDWYALPAELVERRLQTDTSHGLSSDDALRRLRFYGPNAVSTEETGSMWPLLLRQFTDPLTAVLFVAVAISAAVGEILDAAAIALIVLVNGVLGFVQEWRADRAIEALQAMLAPHARVRRDGRSQQIDASGLVLGDVVELEAGDQVPADVRVVESSRLLADESALTGESLPQTKTSDEVSRSAPLADRSCALFFGTVVAAGRGVGVVVATADATEFGTIVSLTGLAGRSETGSGRSPLQQSLAGLSRRLGEVSVGLAALTVLIGVVAGRPLTEMFLTGVSLAVAIVPEGLPAVVTVTLALGLRAMSRRRALLRHLEAAETLGAASVICTDKTGTLTQNRMAVRQVWTHGGVSSVSDLELGLHERGLLARPTSSPLARLLDTAQICNHAVVADHGAPLGDPTEVALLELARRLHVTRPDVEIESELPFDSATKLMAVVVADRRRVPDDGKPANQLHVKGAPEVVVSQCTHISTIDGVVSLSSEDHQTFAAMVEQMGDVGLRTLAFASASVAPGFSADGGLDGGLTLLGLVGMHDPPRPEVPEAVANARSAGLDVVVMTGDAGNTALAIAREVGLEVDDVLVGTELDAIDDDSLLRLLNGSHVLARVTPGHKMRVVELLQRHGAVVAMTGDGVNDAPALKQASIGVAMGERGTDAARGAADLVLVDDNFASIVAAIEEGRRQFSNIRKFIRYLLSSNLGEVIAVSGSVALGLPLILVPAQILWINLMTDGVTALALGVEPVEPDAMSQPPRRIEESIVGRSGVWWIAGCGGAIGAASLLVFWLTLGSGDGADLLRAQTLAFTSMVLLETVNVFNFRSERQSVFSVGLLSNRWLVAACGAALIAQAAAVHAPGLSTALGTTGMSAEEWLILSVVALPLLAAGELAKLSLRRSHG